jgi:hypothetical protein
MKVILVHRHGARFPKKSYALDPAFPGEVFKNNKEALFPQGCRRFELLGRELKDKYPFLSPSSTRVFCSNTQRTVLSTLCLVESLFPGERYSFGNQRNTIPIKITEDTFFHAEPEKLKRRQDENYSQLFNYNYNIIPLLDKLYSITSDPVLSPEVPYWKRFVELHEVYSHYKSCEFSGVPFLEVEGKEKLTKEEFRLLERCADTVCHHQFRGNEDRFPSLLVNNFLTHLRRELDESKGFTIYSAHDTTLVALATILNWTVPCPDFASYMIFEIEDDVVRVGFNPEPQNYDLTQVKFREINPDVLLDF